MTQSLTVMLASELLAVSPTLRRRPLLLEAMQVGRPGSVEPAILENAVSRAAFHQQGKTAIARAVNQPIDLEEVKAIHFRSSFRFHRDCRGGGSQERTFEFGDRH